MEPDLQTGASSPADNELVDVRTGTRTTWRELPTATLPEPAAVVIDSSFAAAPWVAAHAATGQELLVVAAARMEPELRAELLTAGFNVVADRGAQPPAVEHTARARPAVPDRVWLLTSGSTGRPKQVAHTLASLTTVSGELPPRRWLCPYSPGTYAWWQLVTLSLAHPGQDLVMLDPSDLDRWVDAAVEHRVTAASGTPTFWRQTMMAHRDRLTEVPLEQITLGGEPVDQTVLDQLRQRFPQARISWIYASSEVGAAIVVHDGRAGFPAAWLDRDEPGRPTISVADGELVIRSPHHGDGLAGAVRTGDAVVEQDGRVLITGRLDRDEINVGGAKASAGVIRSVVQAHPQVAWAAVRGRRSALIGHLVVAEVVLRDGATESPELLEEIGAWCRTRLPEYAVPRRLTVLPEIPATATLKSEV
ncbi:MAG TPA: fatty acid--CoA ligase family protein [Marmoricola sp.]|nr:fatty acid--CoA ligase family protein [Marmoricola sp.]